MGTQIELINVLLLLDGMADAAYWRDVEKPNPCRGYNKDWCVGCKHKGFCQLKSGVVSGIRRYGDALKRENAAAGVSEAKC